MLHFNVFDSHLKVKTDVQYNGFINNNESSGSNSGSNPQTNKHKNEMYFGFLGSSKT